MLSCGSEESRLADSYYQNKNYNKAIEYYTESLKLKPNDTQSLYRRGRSFEEIKQFQNAIKDYNKVLELDKENVKTNYNLGSAYLFLGDTSKAEKDKDVKPK